MIFKDLDKIKKCTRPSDWWTKYVLHIFSTRLVSLLKDTRVTPNQLTLLSTLIVALACLLICLDNYFSGIIATVVLQIGLILDCADGQLARFKNLATPYGRWYDKITDKVKDFIIIFSLTLRYSRTDTKAWILGFICFFIMFLLDYYGYIFKDFSDLFPRENILKRESIWVNKLKSFKKKSGLAFFQTGEQYLSYSIFLILNRIDWLFYFIIVYTGIAAIWVPFNKWREYQLLRKRNCNTN